MRPARSVLALTLICSALSACDEPAGVQTRSPQPGVLQLTEYDGAMTVDAPPDALVWSVAPGDGVLVPPGVLVAPDTVDAGHPFDVTVTTIGLSGCWREAHQSVAVGTGLVELEPLDMHSGAEACTDIVLYLNHTSRVMLESTGEWVIRVTGRRMRQGDHAWEQPVAAEKTIYVR